MGLGAARPAWGQAAKPFTPRFTSIAAKSTERVLLLPGDGEERAKILPKRSCVRGRLLGGTQECGCSGFAGVGVLRALQAGWADVEEKEGWQDPSSSHPCVPSSIPPHSKAREQDRQGEPAITQDWKVLNWTQPLWGRSWPKSSTFHRGVFTLGEVLLNTWDDFFSICAQEEGAKIPDKAQPRTPH